MHLDKPLQTALAVFFLSLTVEALTLEGDLIPRSDKLNAAPSKKWSTGVFERATSPTRGTDFELDNYFNRTDCQWYTMIEIGNPSQYVTVSVGTTSMPLLVPALNCTSCYSVWAYGPENSTTFVRGDGNATRHEFSTGPDTMPLSKPMGASCRLGNDTVGFGNLQVNNQTFVFCDDYDPILNEMPAGGLLGLDTYDPNAPFKSLFWNLWEARKLDNPIFSLYIPAGVLDSGKITLGGLDPTRFTGEVHYMRLHQQADGSTGGNWVVAQNALYANERLLGNSSDGATPMPVGYALFDTGTAFIQTPDRATAVALYAQLSPKFELIDPAGAWGAPCDAMAALAPTLTFNLGSGLEVRNFTIPAQNFNLGEYPTKKGYCQGIFNSPIAPLRGPDNKPLWVFGSPFIKAYYSVWNGLKQEIGFADLAVPDAPQQSGS